MELLLGDLLECMDKKYPYVHTLEELENIGFSQYLVLESLEKGFISDISELTDPRNIKSDNINDSLFVLSSDGFLALNQIRLKKATEKLNVSINNFNASSSKSANRIEILTWIIAVFAGITAIPLIFEIAKFIISLLGWQ